MTFVKFFKLFYSSLSLIVSTHFKSYFLAKSCGLRLFFGLVENSPLSCLFSCLAVCFAVYAFSFFKLCSLTSFQSSYYIIGERFHFASILETCKVVFQFTLQKESTRQGQNNLHLFMTNSGKERGQAKLSNFFHNLFYLFCDIL